MHNRLRIILKQFGDNQTKLAKKMGVSRAYVSGLATGKDSIGLKVVKKILDIYPELNARWFITGIGEPVQKSNKLEMEKELDLMRKIIEKDQEIKNLKKSE